MVETALAVALLTCGGLLLQTFSASPEYRSRKFGFFVFADTVAARNYQGTNQQHGLGIRFQTEPGAQPSEKLLTFEIRRYSATRNSDRRIAFINDRILARVSSSRFQGSIHAGARRLGYTARQATMLHNGQRLGPYQVVTLIGKGGMGEVYKARDTRLNRDVALKLIGAHQIERL